MARVRGRVSAGLVALVAAALLVGIAGAPAQAQVLIGSLDHESDVDACNETKAFVELGQILCDGSLFFDCTPDADACERTCKTAAKACTAETKADLTEDFSDVHAELNVLKTQCKSTNDPKACKKLIKSEQKTFKDAIKVAKRGVKDSCRLDSIVQACEDVCNEVLVDDVPGDFDDFLDCNDFELEL